MALILHLETATTVCSVALSRNGGLIALRELNDDYTHAENLTLFIEQVMKEAAEPLTALDAIAVSKGPGSYTGLRIGVSTAKGLCYALEKPLLSVNTLQALSAAVTEELGLVPDPDTLFCPMLDARRMEVYCAMFNSAGEEVLSTAAVIVDKDTFSELLEKRPVVFFGDGASKCREMLTHHANAIFKENIFPSAKYMIPFAEKALEANKTEDIAYFEPFYLKDFVAGKKKTAPGK